MPEQNTRRFPVMQEMTVKEVREYLTHKKSIILPLGVIEQHGYHLPLATDAIIATHLSRQAGERTGVLVAPTIHQSFSGGGLEGTINISPAVMSLVVSDTLVALVSQGFRNFYLVLCHGGSENLRALNDALRILLRSNPAFRDVLIALCPIWKLSTPGVGVSKGFAEHDWHAGWWETALIMAFTPDLVQMDQMQLDPEPVLSQQIAHPDNYQHAEKIVDDLFVVPRLSQRPDIKVGVMGHPEKATPELGRQIAEDMVTNLSRKIEKIESKADGKYREVKFIPEPLALGEE